MVRPEVYIVINRRNCYNCAEVVLWTVLLVVSSLVRQILACKYPVVSDYPLDRRWDISVWEDDRLKHWGIFI